MNKKTWESKSLIATDDLLIAGSSGKTNALVALTYAKGKEKWRVSVPGELLETGLVVNGASLWAITVEKKNTVWHLREFQTLTGDAIAATAGPRGANFPLIVDGALYVSSREDTGKQSGLWVRRPGEDRMERIVEATGAGAPKATSGMVAVAVRRDKTTYELVALSSKGHQVLWSAPSREFGLDADAGQFASIEVNGAKKTVVVLRNAADGEVIWESEPLPEAGIYPFFAADVVGVVDIDGITLLDRKTGKKAQRLESEVRFSWGGGLAPGRLILGDGSEVICYASTKK